MKKNYLIGIAIVLASVLVVLIVKSIFFGKPGKAALEVFANPKATVYLDGNKIGLTPLLYTKLEAKEHLVKIVPENEQNFPAWETKVNFVPDLSTIINRSFGSSETASAGEVIWLEKIGTKDKSALQVISIPDGAMVKVDGASKGFTPTDPIEDLKPGSYQVVVTSTGFEERTITAKTVAGYKMFINVQLAQKVEGIVQATSSPELILTPTPSPKVTPKPTVGVAIEKPYVTIKETPTGWLRVRMAPSTTATEAAKVDPGKSYPYLNEEENGWYKIEYEKEKNGWISKVYAELVE